MLEESRRCVATAARACFQREKHYVQMQQSIYLQVSVLLYSREYIMRENVST